MVSIRQEELAEAIVKNKRLPRDKRKNKQQLLESVGYATTTATSQPSRELNAKGVKEALSKYGLTEDLITTALVSDIREKPKRRFHELSLGADILGMKVKPTDVPPPQEITQNITQIIINNPHAKSTGDKPN